MRDRAVHAGPRLRAWPESIDAVLVAGVALVVGGALPFAPWEVTVGAAGVVVAVAWGRAARARAALSVAVVVAACLALGAVRAARSVARHEGQLHAADVAIPRPARCEGIARVTSSPVLVRGALRWQAALRDATCDGVPWSGPVTLYEGDDAGGSRDRARGDDVAVVCDLAGPMRFWNLDDPRPSEARRGSVRSGGALSARLVAPGRGLVAWIDRARARIRANILASFDADVAPMVRALVLGESDLSPEDDAAMRGSGLAHLLAVSGMHLVIAVVALVSAIRAVLVRVEAWAARADVGRVAALAGIPLAWGYAEIAGDGGSTRRAAWMLTVAFAARALGRRADTTRAFAWSLLAMGAADALAVDDVSFVLSAAATAGLVASSRVAERIAARAPRVARHVVESAIGTLSASLACAPVVARFAPTLPLGGVVANLLAVPVGESIALPVCLAHAVLAPWPAAARGAALVATGALRVVRAIARAFAAPALVAHVPSPTAWQIAVLAVAAAALLASTRGGRGPIALAALAAILVLEGGARRAGAPKGELRVTFLDVGQGDAALVDLPDGSAAILDGGGFVGSPIDTGERVIAPVLRARRRDALALAVLSHPHPDHFGGLATGLGGARVGALWDSGQGEREGVAGGYRALLDAMRAQGTPVLRPPEICGARALGGARLDVLAPCPGTSPDRGPNDNSIVLRVSYGARAFLFVGDAEHEEEADLLRLDRARLRADVLKVGHHGSRTSSSPALLAAVAPREAVISSGVRNRFGHPADVTLASLAAAGAHVWRTDREGAVTITTDGASLEVRTARGEAATIAGPTALALRPGAPLD